MAGPQPQGFTRVFPYIFADDPDRLLNFLKSGLSATEERVDRAPDGSLGNAQMRFGDTVVMVTQARAEWPATKATYFLYVDHVDVAHQKALEAGGTNRMDPSDMDYGMRQSGVQDPAGNIWWLSASLPDVEQE